MFMSFIGQLFHVLVKATNTEEKNKIEEKKLFKYYKPPTQI